MSPFFRQRPSLQDPLFGPVLQDQHGWKAEVPSPSGIGRVEVRGGHSRVDAPDEKSRDAYAEVVRSYTSTSPRIQAALFSLWQPELQSGDWGPKAPSTPEDLWSSLTLEAITVEPDGACRLYYAFTGEFWPDASLAVRLADGLVRPLHIND